jgi:hypothetical protein
MIELIIKIIKDLKIINFLNFNILRKKKTNKQKIY